MYNIVITQRKGYVRGQTLLNIVVHNMCPHVPRVVCELVVYRNTLVEGRIRPDELERLASRAATYVCDGYGGGVRRYFTVRDEEPPFDEFDWYYNDTPPEPEPAVDRMINLYMDDWGRTQGPANAPEEREDGREPNT